MFEGKVKNTINLSIEVNSFIKDLVNKLEETLPSAVISKLNKDKKYNIKNKEYTSSYAKYKSEGYHQTTFKYQLLEHSSTLNYFELTSTEIDDKYLTSLPIYYDGNQGMYDYNYILSIEYKVGDKCYEYDLEIRKIDNLNFCLVVNDTIHDKELSKKHFTRSELLNKIHSKAR